MTQNGGIWNYLTSFMPPTKKPKISIYVSEEQKKILEEWADSETRSISNLVNHLIERGIDEYLQQKSKQSKSKKEES